MNILDSIIVTAKAADVIFNFATFGWTKKAVARLIISVVAFGTAAVLIAVTNKKEAKEKACAN